MPSRLGLLGVSGPIGGGVAPPSSFVPTDIYGMELWVYQPDIDYSAGTWVDRSGNVRNLIQGTAGNRPTLSAALAELNGKYSAIHDGVNDFLATAAQLIVAQPFSVLAVAKITSDSTMLWNNGLSASPITGWYRGGSTNFQMGFGTGVSKTVSDMGKYNSLATLVQGASSLMGFNGALGATVNPNTNGLAERFYTGSVEGTSSFGAVSISDFMIYRGKLGAYDLMRLWNEWVAADRYNIPITFSPTSITGCQLWVRGAGNCA